MDATPFLETGDMLVEPGRQPIHVQTDLAVADVTSGATRLTRTLGLTVKSYVSTSALEAPGRPVLPVRAPRQANVAAKDLLPESAVPLAYDAHDPWDHRYLARAEALGNQLQLAATGLDNQLAPDAGQAPAFYKALLPALDKQVGFDDAFYRIQEAAVPIGQPSFATPGNYLVATVIALHGTAGSFAERMTEEFGFARQGADWGLVAYDQGVADDASIPAEVLAAIDRAPLQFALPPGQAIFSAGPTTTVLPSLLASPPTVARPPAPTHSQPPPGQSSPTLPQAPSPPPLPGNNLVSPLLDPLTNAVNQTLGGVVGGAGSGTQAPHG
jgi:hypothetical protein